MRQAVALLQPSPGVFSLRGGVGFPYPFSFTSPKDTQRLLDSRSQALPALLSQLVTPAACRQHWTEAV